MRKDVKLNNASGYDKIICNDRRGKDSTKEEDGICFTINCKSVV